MKTVGEILKKARQEKKIELETVERKLRIRKKFLTALEDNDWSKLPSLPYIKGFLRNYSLYLNLKPEEMIAVFRRQYAQKEKKPLMPSGVANPLNQPLLRITPKVVVTLITSFFTIVFFTYLFFQYRAFTSPPSLEIQKPREGEVLFSDKTPLEGKTDSDAVVSVNGQKIAVSDDGAFSTNINLSPGINTILIESVSKHGKKQSVTRTIQAQI